MFIYPIRRTASRNPLWSHESHGLVNVYAEQALKYDARRVVYYNSQHVVDKGHSTASLSNLHRMKWVYLTQFGKSCLSTLIGKLRGWLRIASIQQSIVNIVYQTAVAELQRAYRRY